MLNIVVPLKIVSSANLNEHWTQKIKRKNLHKNAIAKEFLYLNSNIPTVPCRITLSRIAPRLLDEDNLLYALKTCRDVVCDMVLPGLRMGRADASSQIRVEYNQEKSKNNFYALRIIIESE